MGADAAAEEQFGPYVVYERLGVGGMATVHRALERGIEGFERVVALKRLLPHLAADASFIKSFVREAKLASYLNHVNIVQLFELGRVGPAYFISMEYIDGRDIRRILRQARRVAGPPPVHVTVGLLLQLCEALDYAHHKVDDSGHPLGLVHRDVSPSNVLVTTTGCVKVIDFGIAKAQSAQLRTQTGRVKGKLAYMAPEALAGKELDARSDLFAVGVIAHELLTARPLFATKNEYQTLMKVQRGDAAPPSTFNPACPPELDAIVLRALARDPDDRFRHASDLCDALHALRKLHQMQTAERDIVMWLDWAFRLEAPPGGAAAHHAIDPSAGPIDARSTRGRAARPKRSEEDEAVEVAWGDGEELSNGQPVLLDDVPDVSDKHLSSASALGAEVRLDLDDLADIPTPVPSYAGRPAGSQIRFPVREKQLTPTFAMHASQAVPEPAARDRSQPVPAPRDRSQPMPAARDRSQPVPAARDRSQPVPAARDRSQPVPAAHDRSQPVPAAHDRSQPVPAARDRSQPVPAAHDRSQPVPAARDRSQPVPAARDRSQLMPAARDRSQPVPAAHDRSQPMPASVASERDNAVPVAHDRQPMPAAHDRSQPVPASVASERGNAVPVAHDRQPMPAARDRSQPMVVPAARDRSQPMVVPAARDRSQPMVVPAARDRSQPTVVPAARDRSQPVMVPVARERGHAVPTAHDRSKAVPIAVPAARERSQAVRGPQASVAAASAVVGATVPALVMPPRVRTITSAPRMAAASTAPPNVAVSAPQSAVGSTEIPRDLGSTAPPHGDVHTKVTPVGGVPSSWAPPHSQRSVSPPRRAASTITPLRGVAATRPQPRRAASVATATSERLAALARPRPARHDTATTESDPPFPSGEVTPQPGASSTERTPLFHIEEAAAASDTIPSMPPLSVAEPTVRFHEPATLPPSNVLRPPASVAPPAPGGMSPSPSDDDPSPLAALSPPSAEASSPSGIAGSGGRPVPPAMEAFSSSELETNYDAEPIAGYLVPASPTVDPTTASVPLWSNAPPPERTANRRAMRTRVLPLAAVLVVGAAGAAVVAQHLGSNRAATAELTPPAAVPAPPPRASTIATLKLVLVPADAAITIEGTPVHAGSPWDVELAPGVHQIEIRRDGYKAWLTSIDLAAGEIRPVHVVLEPLGAAIAADATLIVSSTPAALEAMLDGAPVASRTPFTVPLKAGLHSLSLRSNGVDVWKRDVEARASAVYEFSPVITSGATRPADPAAPVPVPVPVIDGASGHQTPPGSPASGLRADPVVAPPDAALGSNSIVPGSPPAPALGGQPPPLHLPLPTLGRITSPRPLAPPAPLTVPPSAVAKLSGDLPALGSAAEPAVSARLCIDEAGHVTSAELLKRPGPPDAHATEIATALRAWQYAPYSVDGIPRAACFDVTLHAK